ncbi:anoctamin-1 isoform X2 [Bacillus rossius redtenbacheri]|uniref:anoctamin-1 isoform X2 n=1 Tax=Bacillus rossius redtenbacheri TaxID=93214 RepID=UPI002FDF05B1
MEEAKGVGAVRDQGPAPDCPLAMEEDEDDVFEDTVSLPRRSYMSLSQVTVYHSAEDLSGEDRAPVTEDTALVQMEEPVEQVPMNDMRKPSVTFYDEQESNRSVDFVLVWREPTASQAASPSASVAAKKRQLFESNLEHEGLILDREKNKQLHFVKIHADKEVLCRYAEILKLRLPMKDFPGQEEMPPSFDIMDEVKSVMRRLLDFVHVDPKVFKPTPRKLTAEFSRDKSYLFDMESEKFFTPAIRSLVVDFILQRQRFDENENSLYGFGIQRLITEDVYSAAYPLHDGDLRTPGSMRYLLYHEWASVRKWIMYQPVDHIKDYFGVKFGLYFAWLGFYTHMLIPAAIFGLICFLYGVSTLFTNRLSEDICSTKEDIMMCPLCDKTCGYWNLRETCLYARITYLFDNPFTVAFAFFMSFWGTLFLELWKRYSASITHHWGLTGFDLMAEHPRPEYLARLANVKSTKLNVVTGLEEPYVPFWKVRVPATVLSFSVVLLLMLVAVAAVFGVVLYRMAQVAAFSLANVDDYNIMILYIPITAALINLVCITLLNYLYDWLAVRLTELELLRTQTEFDDSLTLKIYLFQFVNYYTSIFYIAFMKGKFVGYPSKYNRILKYRQEECSPGGCLMELCIQLGIIMVGKQALNSILEMVIPYVMKWWNTFKIKTGLQEKEEDFHGCSQWTEDFKLVDWGPRGLFPEYLEMVLQYGFVTIFVAAFPLAPFFALVNNIFEMRLDAKKFLRFYRRPVPHRVKSIGVWYRILDVISRVSVITNALIIAFSSNFIPLIVYASKVNPDHTDEGFLNFSLSYFNTADFSPKYAPLEGYAKYNVSVCRYLEYRNPYWDDHKYKRPPIYWHILAARLAFVVVFQNVVGLVMMAVQWLIPDQSRRLRDEIRREAYLTSELIIKQETLRARGEAAAPGASTGDFLREEKDRVRRSASVGNHVRFRSHDTGDATAV